jgi:hypothetical protein
LGCAGSEAARTPYVELNGEPDAEGVGAWLGDLLATCAEELEQAATSATTETSPTPRFIGR